MQIDARMSTPDDMHLPAFDFTRLSAINACPRKGILQYTLHKTMYYGGRAMALEAGKLMHDCFAVVRLYQLGHVQGHTALMHHHGVRLFGDTRWQQVYAAPDDGAAHNVSARNLAWQVMATADYVDDPDDKKRTYANIESSIAYYCDRWDMQRYPVWVRDPSDPRSDVGIEIPFDIVVTIDNDLRFRYIGRVDGIHTNARGTVVIHENKSAYRLDKTWRDHFRMSHQPTGYCIAASVFTGEPVNEGVIIGLQNPLPKTLVDGVMYQPFTRDKHMLEQWAVWAEHTIMLHETYAHDVHTAPTYTGSCRSYNRPCEFIPYCESDSVDKTYMLDNMHTRHWSPLVEAGDTSSE